MRSRLGVLCGRYAAKECTLVGAEVLPVLTCKHCAADKRCAAGLARRAGGAQPFSAIQLALRCCRV